VELTVDDAHAEAVRLSPGRTEGRPDARTWALGDPVDVLLHEVLHYLGLPDEYVDPEFMFRAGQGSAGVRADGVMAWRGLDLSQEMPARYLQVIEDVVDSGPVIYDHPLNDSPAAGAGDPMQPTPADPPTHPAPSAPPSTLSHAEWSAAQADRMVRTGLESIGFYRWRGGTKLDPHDGWQVSETTSWGKTNGFTRWLRGNGDQPGLWSTMNCYEVFLFIAYRLGLVDKAWLVGIHAEGSEAAIAAAPGGARAASKAFFEKMASRVLPGMLTRHEISRTTGLTWPDVPRGHLILIDGFHHVMLSLGTRDAQGRQEVLSHWALPDQTPSGRISTEESYGFMQRTTLEQVLAVAGYIADPVIESGMPVWLM
jgi:hypothetical protein